MQLRKIQIALILCVAFFNAHLIFASTVIEKIERKIEDELQKPVIAKLYNNKEYLGADVDINKIEYKSGNKFIAHIGVQKGPQDILLDGLYQEAMLLPVPKYNIKKGGKIKQDDLRHIKIKSSNITSDVIKSAKDITEMEAKNTLYKNQAIKTGQLTKEKIIKKGDVVKVKFSKNGIFIEATCESLDYGGTGDIIKLRNIDSKKIINAQIQQNGEVVIR